MAAHAKALEEANLAKAELQDVRSKLLEATKKVVTLEVGTEELKEEVGAI